MVKSVVNLCLSGALEFCRMNCGYPGYPGTGTGPFLPCPGRHSYPVPGYPDRVGQGRNFRLGF
eukprot:288739-Rhodomonas_salina.1